MFQSDKISRSRARIFSTSASTVAAWTSDGSDISEGIRRHQYLSVLWLVSVVYLDSLTPSLPLPSPAHFAMASMLQTAAMATTHELFHPIPIFVSNSAKYANFLRSLKAKWCQPMSTCFSQIACKTALNPAVNGRGISMTSIFALT